jgi:hypothetical protein
VSEDGVILCPKNYTPDESNREVIRICNIINTELKGQYERQEELRYEYVVREELLEVLRDVMLVFVKAGWKSCIQYRGNDSFANRDKTLYMITVSRL